MTKFAKAFALSFASIIAFFLVVAIILLVVKLLFGSANFIGIVLAVALTSGLFAGLGTLSDKK
jgi:hypothetical protein